MKYATEFMNSSIVKAAKNNLTLIMFIGGMVFILLSAFIDGRWGDGLSKVGGAILGAGVFAAIMKSSQFTQVFKKHIYDVLYDPVEAEKDDKALNNKVKWSALTESILRDTLPSFAKIAANKIEKTFFNDELSYHYEDYTVQYDIEVDEHMIATMKNTTIVTLVLAKNNPNPVYEQSVKVISDSTTIELTSLYLNSVKYDLSKYYYTQNTEDEKVYKIHIPLNDLKDVNENKIKLERTTTWKQNLKEDPWMTGFINRYIKGLTVKAKVSDEYKLVFDKFGLEKLPENYYAVDHDYDRWQLADSKTLLLPGQGYVLTMVKK